MVFFPACVQNSLFTCAAAIVYLKFTAYSMLSSNCIAKFEPREICSTSAINNQETNQTKSLQLCDMCVCVFELFSGEMDTLS